GEVAKVPSAGVVNAPLVVFLGLGDADSLSPAVVRRAAGAAVRSVPNAATLALALPTDTLPLLSAVVEGAVLGGYTFDRYKSESAANTPGVGEVVVLSPLARQAEAEAAFEEALLVAG